MSQIVPKLRLPKVLMEQAELLTRGFTSAQGHARQLVRSSFERSFAEQLEAEAAAIAICAASIDGRQGVSDYLQIRGNASPGKSAA